MNTVRSSSLLVETAAGSPAPPAPAAWVAAAAVAAASEAALAFGCSDAHASPSDLSDALLGEKKDEELRRDIKRESAGYGRIATRS